VTITTENCKNGDTTLSHMNFSGYVRHVTIRFSDWLVSGYARV